MQIHITRRWMSHCVDVKFIDLEKWKMATDAEVLIIPTNPTDLSRKGEQETSFVRYSKIVESGVEHHSPNPINKIDFQNVN